MTSRTWGPDGGGIPISSANLNGIEADITNASDFGRIWFGFTGNGTYLEKANVCYSPDGRRVTAGNNNPVFTDGHTGASFRDPSLLKIGSTWFCAYTINNGYSKNLGVISSKDLVNWATVATVDVSTATSINQAWAPELVLDTNGDVYMFFTNVTAANAQSIWYVKATDATGLTTWGSPTAITWASNPGNIWDAAFIKNGSTWYMFYSYGGYIQRANCTSLTGTWTTDKTGDWAGWWAGVGGTGMTLEGGEIMQDGSTWRMYFDPYNGSAVSSGYYYSESTDFTTWTTPVQVSKATNFPPGQILRHGAWVKLTSDADRNIALAAVAGGGLPVSPHVEITGSVTVSDAIVTDIGSPTVVSGSTNNDKMVTCSGSGIFVPAATGLYDVRGQFAITSGSNISRTFANLTDAQNSDALIVRTAGAAEDNFQLNAPKVVLTAGHQYRVQIFQHSTGSATFNATVGFTYCGRAS